MNKQEAIKELTLMKNMNEDVLEIEEWDTGLKCGARRAYENAINIVKQIDEPEKPVLSKTEAEWVDKLTDFYSLPDALYYITRCGYGYLFVFEMAKKTYELPVDSGATYGEFCKLKERLVNAVIYGYEVEKEKLYTAQLKSTGEYLHYDIETDKIHHFFAYGNTAKNSKDHHFTKGTLIQYNAWGNNAYEVKEVEE